jgi:hypothetical protein
MRAMNGAGIAIELPLPLPRHARRGRMIADNIRSSPPLQAAASQTFIQSIK